MQLISITDWYRKEYNKTRVRHDYVGNWLKQLAAEDERFKYFTTENDFFVANDDMTALLRDFITRRMQTVAIQPKTEHPLDKDLVALETRVDQLETLVLEQDSHIVNLERATQQMFLVYEALRAATGDPKNYPEAPKLPTRYKYRVLIVGGDSRTKRAIEPLFPQIKFLHIEAGGAAGDTNVPRKMTWPNVDVVCTMTSFMGHGLEAGVRNAYRPDQIIRITGTTSALESALRVWVVTKEQEAERQANVK